MHLTNNQLSPKTIPFIIKEPDPQVVLAQKFKHYFFIIDLLLVNVSFFLLNFIKRDTLFLQSHYLKLLLLFNATWLVVSLFTKKFNLNTYLNFKNAVIVLTKSNLYILLILSLTIVLMKLYAYSRIHVFGAVSLLFILEMVAFSVYYWIDGRKLMERQHGPAHLIEKYAYFSVALFSFDFVLLIASFFLVNYWKRGTLVLNPNYELLVLLIAGLWLVISVLTRKFDRRHYRNIFHFLAPYLKAFILMFAVSAVIVFALRLFQFSRTQIFGTLVLFVLLETIIYYLYYITAARRKRNEDIETVEEVQKLLKQEELPLELEKINALKNREVISVDSRLKNKYLKDRPALYQFIAQQIDLKTIDEEDCSVLNTHTLYNIETLNDHTKSLLINLHKLNDIRWLNRYFLQVHRKIYNGGYLVGLAHTISTRREWFYSKYPALIANFLYPFDFLVRRVLPKLPGVKKIYFTISGGKNRVLSKAEILGRLYFCGFRVVAVDEFEHRFVFIAQRIKTPSLDDNPSYGPTIRLKRIGLDGKIIYTRKFRTMHPYSEYLQEYIFENYSLQSNGKFNDDFRVTEWGRWFRKLWIDELPQLVNFLQGEMNLVGVRALSQHYFSLYPRDLQELRIQFKPGLVPPYYADMPKSFDEIVASERKYLRAKKEKPLTTDLKYFFKAMYNIFFRNARSR